MNPKKRLLLTFVILLVAGITVIAALIYQNGKGYDEDTNRTEDMIPADRGMEETVSQDMLEMDQTKFQYSLPDGFYLEYEDSAIDGGCMKEYMDHDYQKVVDVYLYEIHKEDVGILDPDHPERSAVYNDVTVDADEWLRQMRLTFLERDDESDISTEEKENVAIQYFIKYHKNEDGIMQGTLAGVLKIDAEHYYCVKISEFDQDEAPDIEKYKVLF